MTADADATPFLSVVIPVWNRSASIRRCLDSVFSQEYDDYEVVAVDDGSEDDSVAVMESYHHPKLRVIRLPENRGVCAARNAGTSAARGRWIVSLDTDWSLLPGALASLARRASEAPADVGVIGGRARSDRGELWPFRTPPAQPFGFEGYLHWTDHEGPTDYQPCRRRELFQTVEWPRDRRLETQFHLAVAKKWRMWISEEVLSTVYTNEPNRWSTDRSAKGMEKKMLMAPFLAQDNHEILVKYGEEMKRHAPTRYWSALTTAITYCWQAGWRGTALKYTAIALARKPWAVHLVLLAAAGMLGPRAIARMRRIGVVRGTFNWLHRMVTTSVADKPA